MNYYLIAKFVHIVGALGMFVVLGVEWLSLWSLRRAASNAKVQEWIQVERGIQRLGGASMAALLISGFYMMAVARIDAPWLIVSFASLILTGLLAGALTGRHRKAIQQSVDTEMNAISPALQQLLHKPLLWVVMQLRVAVILGVVFLMTAKPDLIGSLLTLGGAGVIGIASALLTSRREEANKREPDLHRI